MSQPTGILWREKPIDPFRGSFISFVSNFDNIEDSHHCQRLLLSGEKIPDFCFAWRFRWLLIQIEKHQRNEALGI